MVGGEKDAVVVVGDFDGFATGEFGVFAGFFNDGDVGVVVADASTFGFELLGEHVAG